MAIIILRRLLAALPSLAGVVVVTFILTRALPGDPAVYFAGPAATQEAIAEIQAAVDAGIASGPAAPLDRAAFKARMRATHAGK